MRTSKVITKVARATPLSPNARVNKAVASDVARIFTKLLPNKTEPIRRSLSSVMSKARCAPRDPLSACVRNFPREAAVNAVSDPEKNPDSTSNSKIDPVVIQKALSRSGVLGSMGLVFLWGLHVMGAGGRHFKGAGHAHQRIGRLER